MASIYRQRNSRYWYITWMEKVNGRWVHRQRSTHMASKSDALKVLVEFENARMGRSIRAGIESIMESAGAPHKRSFPLSELWKWYTTNCEVSGNPKQIRSRQGFMGAFLLWLNSSHPEICLVEEVTQKLASEYWTFLARQDRSASTRNNCLSALNVVWHSVQASLDLPMNPWSSIRRDLGGSVRYEPFTLDEIKALISATEKLQGSVSDSNFWKAAIEMGFYTGLRLGDIATLEYSELGVEDNFLVLLPNKTRRWGSDHVAVHSLSLPWVRLLPSLSGSGHVFPKAASAYASGSLSREFTAIARLAGITVDREPVPGERRVRNVRLKCFHSLRHSYATYLLKSGLTENELKQQGNWSDTRVISDHYNHAKLDAARRIAEKVSQAFSSDDIFA